MQRIGAEHRVRTVEGPVRLRDVEFQRGSKVVAALERDPGRESRQVLGTVRWLPDEVRQVAREVHGVLTGAAADLEDLTGVCECSAQHVEDRMLVALAGFGEGQHAVSPSLVDCGMTLAGTSRRGFAPDAE